MCVPRVEIKKFGWLDVEGQKKKDTLKQQQFISLALLGPLKLKKNKTVISELTIFSTNIILGGHSANG